MKEEDFERLVNSVSSTLASKSKSEIIQFVRDLLVNDSFSFFSPFKLSSAQLELVKTKGMALTIEYNDQGGLVSIEAIVYGSDWDSVKVNITPVSISVSYQKEHSRFEPAGSINWASVLTMYNFLHEKKAENKS
jgi:hypothetical protein